MIWLKNRGSIRYRIFQLSPELLRLVFTEFLEGGRLLLQHDLLVLLALRLPVDALPGELAAEEVHEDLLAEKLSDVT